MVSSNVAGAGGTLEALTAYSKLQQAQEAPYLALASDTSASAERDKDNLDAAKLHQILVQAANPRVSALRLDKTILLRKKPCVGRPLSIC